MVITNPILPGFHPDPSLLRVGEDYYIANSTFEWFPGVEIHHSRNLADWEFVTRPLSTRAHLDMQGNPPSGGIWAPCLSWSDGVFYLIFTDVKSWNSGPFKDSHNYVTTATDIRGPWSTPVYLNSSGFDASLFHDEGKKWYVNMEWDYRRPGTKTFSGILLQEFDAKTNTLVGPVTKIFEGSPLGLVEGPHLYKKDGWYYLVTAEGGTAYEHAVTVCRSHSLTGPYQLHPANPLITSRDAPSLALQKAGHGSWCDTPDGRWFLAFLVGRPLPGRQDCVLGRETALAELQWVDGWPRLKSGGNHPSVTVVVEPELAPPPRTPSPTSVAYRFDNDTFLRDFMTLRNPWDDETFSLTQRPGWLRLRGKESPVSRHRQALLARRQTDFCFTAETVTDFAPRHFQHMAGFIYRYDETAQYYLRLSWDEKKKARTLGLMVFDQGQFSLPLGNDEVDAGSGEVRLRLVVRYASAQFSWTQGNQPWRPVGPELDAGKISDDYGGLGFTGAFVGMVCQDLERGQHPADFSLFTYTADR